MCHYFNVCALLLLCWTMLIVPHNYCEICFGASLAWSFSSSGVLAVALRVLAVVAVWGLVIVSSFQARLSREEFWGVERAEVTQCPAPKLLLVQLSPMWLACWPWLQFVWLP